MPKTEIDILKERLAALRLAEQQLLADNVGLRDKNRQLEQRVEQQNRSLALAAMYGLASDEETVRQILQANPDLHDRLRKVVQ